MFAQYVLMYDRMLCGEAFVWKCAILLACGVFADVATAAMLGSSR